MRTLNRKEISGMSSLLHTTSDDKINDALIKLSQGNSDCLSIIYNEYNKTIYSVAYQITHDLHDAEDVLQDVMVKITLNAKKYRPNTNPKAWILKITRNIALDKIKRKQKNELTTDFSYLEENQESQLLLINEALNTLSPKDQLIVKLKIYAGLSHAETATVMNLSLSACKKRYERSIYKLKQYFT